MAFSQQALVEIDIDQYKNTNNYESYFLYALVFFYFLFQWKLLFSFKEKKKQKTPTTMKLLKVRVHEY